VGPQADHRIIGGANRPGFPVRMMRTMIK
jgi:hypothetical protein